MADSAASTSTGKFEHARQDLEAIIDEEVSIAREETPVKFLFAVDCTEHSSDAVRFALKLVNGARGDSAHVLQVTNLAKHEASGLSKDLLTRMKASEARCAKINVGQVQKLLQDAGLTAVTTAVEDGDARTIIVSEAAHLGATLVVLGSRGLSTQQRVFEASTAETRQELNSVSDFVSEMAKCSVLVVKAPRAEAAEIKFLVALNATHHARTAFRAMLGLARAGDKALLLAVQEPILSADDLQALDETVRAEAAAEARALEGQRRSELDRMLEIRAADCLGAGVVATTLVQTRVFPPHAVVQRAEDPTERVDVVVVGAGRQTAGISHRPKLGAVSSYVNRNVRDRSVLVVRA